MNMDNIAQYVSTILFAVGILVAVTNIVTEVIKKLTYDKLPTNLLATLVAMVLTLSSFMAVCTIKNITIVWYMGAGAIVLGFFVSYAAMFGYDKLKEILERLCE